MEQGCMHMINVDERVENGPGRKKDHRKDVHK